MATIYLSSTYSDLNAYREAVYHTLLQMRHVVLAMEDDVATDQRPLDKCLADVAKCDLYVGLFAWRYGYVPSEGNPERKSITELEYRTATKTGKHCLIFLLAEDAPWPATAMDAITLENNRGESIAVLRGELTQEKYVSFFKTPEHLASLVGPAVHLWESSQREVRLKAMIADHSAFLRNHIANFQGRIKELTEIRLRIADRQQTGGYVTITGRAGQGKSSIIAKLVEQYAAEQKDGLDGVTFHFIPLNPWSNHQIGLLRNLMARLILKYDLPEFYVDGQSIAELRDYFARILKEVAKRSGQEIIFIDGLDQLEEDGFTDGVQGKRDLSFIPNDVPAGIVFVLGTRPNDTLRPLQLLKPRDEYELSNLSRDDFNLILQHHGIILETHIADQFYHALDENAMFLDLAAEVLEKRGPITGAEVETIIKQITDNPENLFELAIKRLSQRGTFWEQVIKSMLGVLLVAREPLARMHLKQIINLNQALPVDGGQINEGLERLGGLVIKDGQQRYALFHLKLREYLCEDKLSPDKHFVFDIEDKQRLHQWLFRWCEHGGLAGIWDDVWDEITEQERRNYARQNYIAHLYYAQAWSRLFEVLDEGSFGKAKVRYDLSMRTYAIDLDLARQAATSTYWSLEEGIRHLSHLWRHTLLRCSLASRADEYSEAAFKLMLLLGDETKAVGLAELITNPERKALMLLVIARYFAKFAGREADGTRMFLRVEEFISMISDEWQRAIALTDLASALVQADRQAEALRVWAEAKRVCNSIPVKEQRANALMAFATALAQQQQWTEAKRVCNSIPVEEQRANALTTLATALAQQQQWTEAERVCNTIPIEEQRANLLAALATFLAQQQQWTEAERVCNTIPIEEQRANALTTLATFLAQQQQWTEAERVCASISYKWQRANALTTLATALAQQQQWTEAERVCASISNEDEQMEALTALTTMLAAHDEYKRLLRLVHYWWQRVEKRSKAVNLLPLAYAFIPRYPELAMTFSDAFTWVDAFLRG